MKNKHQQLQKLYADFEQAAAEGKAGAACNKGCAFCCTDAGVIDITTMEGLVILDRMTALPKPRAGLITKALQQDMKKREQGRASACPFLMKNKACLIYDVRPFACRRMYSLRTCSKETPPVVSRRVMDLAGQTIAALQRLDDNGYSGHISYILCMLQAPRFAAVYCAGGFKPEEIAVFGKTHRIAFNRQVPDADPALTIP
ncbi:MAG: YkgJ family cysteine cluster protein [Thermodesulfobacteriota bacterium]